VEVDSVSIWHWLIVIFFMLVWGYPLAAICRRAGKPASIGWLASTIGLFFGGPFWCLWWLALTAWDPPKA
jgi:hypothetical protein